MDNNENVDPNKFMIAKDLYCIYKGKEGLNNVVALSAINIEMNKGEFSAIVGTSGAGKSSLLRILGGLQYPSAGEVFYSGVNISTLPDDKLVEIRRKKIGFVFQEGNLLPMYSGYNNVYSTARYCGKSRKEAKEATIQILKDLGVHSRMSDLPHRLSGGERQRFAIAKALVNKPELILADEPTGNLDYENTENVLGLFRDLFNELQTSFLIVTHNEQVANFSDKQLRLLDGKFVSDNPEDEKVNKIVAKAVERKKLAQCRVCDLKVEGDETNCKSCGASLT